MAVIDKVKFLTTIEKMEIVNIQQLANYLGMKYDCARIRLKRYQQRGWVEYIAIDDYRRCLSPGGDRYLSYFKKKTRGD